jgi:hypothetical protein
MSIHTNELPADYWENSVETPGYPYRTYINMENFLALLNKASACWKFYDGAAYYEGQSTQAALRTMANKLGPEAQKLYDEKFKNS